MVEVNDPTETLTVKVLSEIRRIDAGTWFLLESEINGQSIDITAFESVAPGNYGCLGEWQDSARYGRSFMGCKFEPVDWLDMPIQRFAIIQDQPEFENVIDL